MYPLYVNFPNQPPFESQFSEETINARRFVTYQRYILVNNPYGGQLYRLVTETARINKTGEIVNWKKLSDDAYSAIQSYLRRT